MRRSLDADAKMVGLCGDHARCSTSSVCASNVCSGFPNLLISCNKIVCIEPHLSAIFAASVLNANLVCTPGYQEGFSTGIECDGQYLLVVCLYG
jgi:hypothetical protein